MDILKFTCPFSNIRTTNSKVLLAGSWGCNLGLRTGWNVWALNFTNFICLFVHSIYFILYLMSLSALVLGRAVFRSLLHCGVRISETKGLQGPSDQDFSAGMRTVSLQ